MIPYSFLNISFMQLEIFLKCAEYNNFTRAAEKLRITTGMVSKKIASLEDVTGVRLFIREKNRVNLTPAGAVLYKEVTRTLGMMVDAFENAAREQSTADEPIVFGISEATNVDRYFIPLISAFEATEAAASFRVNSTTSFDMIDDLISGRIDIFFAPKFMEEALDSLSSADYFMAVPSPLYVGLSESNPLSKKKTVTMEDICNLDVILPSPQIDSYYRKWIFDLYARHGYIPRSSIYSETGSGAYLNINDTNIFITDKYYHDFQTTAVVFREIENTESGLLMIWRKNPRSAVARFVEHAKRFYQELK